jgi:hypothetical protein
MSVDFAVMALTTDGSTVGTEPTTWGAVKSLFE